MVVFVAHKLLRWAAWTKTATEGEREHENHQHEPSAIVCYPVWFPCPAAAGWFACSATAGMSSSSETRLTVWT
eukprot:6069300-Heterocapsa_arctica.AAC.1